MKRSAVIATGTALLLAGAFAAQAQEKISDGVVKIGVMETCRASTRILPASGQ